MHSYLMAGIPFMIRFGTIWILDNIRVFILIVRVPGVKHPSPGISANKIHASEREKKTTTFTYTYIRVYVIYIYSREEELKEGFRFNLSSAPPIMCDGEPVHQQCKRLAPYAVIPLHP